MTVPGGSQWQRVANCQSLPLSAVFPEYVIKHHEMAIQRIIFYYYDVIILNVALPIKCN